MKIKYIWSIIIGLVGLLLGAFFIIKTSESVKKVRNPVNFVPIPGKSKELLAKSEKGNWTKVKLPGKLISSDVTAIGVGGKHKNMEIEIDHQKVNRRVASSPNPDTRLRL